MNNDELFKFPRRAEISYRKGKVTKLWLISSLNDPWHSTHHFTEVLTSFVSENRSVLKLFHFPEISQISSWVRWERRGRWGGFPKINHPCSCLLLLLPPPPQSLEWNWWETESSIHHEKYSVYLFTEVYSGCVLVYIVLGFQEETCALYLRKLSTPKVPKFGAKAFHIRTSLVTASLNF